MKFKTWKTITIGTKTPPELKEALKAADINVSLYAGDILDNMPLVKKQKVNLVRVTVKELGFTDWTPTEKIYAKAQELGLDLCPAEVGPYLRLAYQDQPLNEWFLIAMKPISDRDRDPNVFYLERHTDGLWLRHNLAGPGNEWNPEYEFAFAVRKSLKFSDPSDTSVPLAVEPFDPSTFEITYQGKQYTLIEKK